MSQHDGDPGARTAAPEPGPQPDPMLNEGRAGAGRKWAVTAVIVAVLLAVMYGITAHRAEERRGEIQGGAPNATATGEALPGGRTTADAPSTPAPETSTRGPSH
jgi:hypothetical protein